MSTYAMGGCKVTAASLIICTLLTFCLCITWPVPDGGIDTLWDSFLAFPRHYIVMMRHKATHSDCMVPLLLCDRSGSTLEMHTAYLQSWEPGRLQCVLNPAPSRSALDALGYCDNDWLQQSDLQARPQHAPLAAAAHSTQHAAA